MKDKKIDFLPPHEDISHIRVPENKNRNDYLTTPVTPYNLDAPPQTAHVMAGNAFMGWAVLTDNYGNVLIGHELISFAHGDGGRVYSLSDSKATELAKLIKPHIQAAEKVDRRDGVIPIVNHMQSPLETMVQQFECAECHNDHKPVPYLPLSPNAAKKYRD